VNKTIFQDILEQQKLTNELLRVLIDKGTATEKTPFPTFEPKPKVAPRKRAK